MRGGPAVGLVVATACGIFTAYTTLQPELEKQKNEREGVFAEQHSPPESQDNVISKAIMTNMREAKKEATSTGTGGFAWGIRQALFGSKQQPDQDSAAKPSPSQEVDRKDNAK